MFISLAVREAPRFCVKYLVLLEQSKSGKYHCVISRDFIKYKLGKRMSGLERSFEV